MFRSLESAMEEFEPSSDAWNWEWRSSSQVPTLGIGKGEVRAKFRRLESRMEEFEPSSDAWNQEWRSSKPSSEAWNREWRSSSQVPNAGAAVGRPHSHVSRGRAGTQCYVRGVGPMP